MKCCNFTNVSCPKILLDGILKSMIIHWLKFSCASIGDNIQ